MASCLWGCCLGHPSARGGRRTAASIPGVSPMLVVEASGPLALLLFHVGADLRTRGTGWWGGLALLVGAGAAWHPWGLHAGGPGPRRCPSPALLAVFPALFSGWVDERLLGLGGGALLSILS